MDEGGRRRAPAHRPPEQGRKPRAAQSLLHGRANAAPSALPARLRRAPRTHLRRRAPAGLTTRNPEHSGASTPRFDCHSRFARKAARRIPADPRRAKSLYKMGKTLKKAESVARHRFAVTRMLILGYWKLCRGTDQCLSCLQTPHQGGYPRCGAPQTPADCASAATPADDRGVARHTAVGDYFGAAAAASRARVSPTSPAPRTSRICSLMLRSTISRVSGPSPLRKRLSGRIRTVTRTLRGPATEPPRPAFGPNRECHKPPCRGGGAVTSPLQAHSRPVSIGQSPGNQILVDLAGRQPDRALRAGRRGLAPELLTGGAGGAPHGGDGQRGGCRPGADTPDTRRGSHRRAAGRRARRRAGREPKRRPGACAPRRTAR